MSLGIANPDYVHVERMFGTDVNRFSPLLAMRRSINPVSEPDVTFVLGVPIDAADEPSGPRRFQ